MAGLDGTAMAGGGTRGKVPARTKVPRENAIGAQVSRQAAGYKRRRRPQTARITFLSPSTFSGAMPRTLQTTWAKLSLAARARFPRTEEERADSRWVADDEALRVAAEAAAKKAGDAEMAEAAAEGWHETADGWYEAAEERATAAEEPVQEEDLALANINAAIEERLADLTRVTKEHEATWRAGRRRLGDLLGQKNELLAMRAARHLIRCPRPSGAPRRTLTRRSAAGKNACAGGRRTTRPAAGRVRLEARTAVERAALQSWSYMASSINFNQFLEKEKLKSNGSNFTDWFRHVRIFLNGGNLQYVLDAPLGDPPAETETDEVKNVYMTRKTRYSQVQCAILCSLESDLQKRFEHHDPHELIKELKTIFETHAAVECYEASKHFFSCMMEEGSSIGEHMLVMTGHAKKLSDLGINMNKEFPELFGMLKAAEIEIKKEHQVLMVNKTTSFKKQGKSKGKNKKSGKKAATPPVKPKSGPKPDAECYYCKEKGHWKRNCSKYLADLKSGLIKKKKEVGKLEAVHGGEILNRIGVHSGFRGFIEAVWMKRFIVELGVVPSALDPFVIYCDNMGAIANAQEPRSHKRLKHIKLRYHSIREYIEDGERSSAGLLHRHRHHAVVLSDSRGATTSAARWNGEVDVVFINNRTCDRVRRCCPFVAPEPIVIKIFYALCKRQVNVYRSNKSLLL
ncbi:hypothetical protein QYE76_038963 [Lolium multiflorum]|uniref:CCHC-type domain-containing protein n=1 Tax=Lolium multiflorum TaxID=4521 RepID=A0AAD8T917_LOLMU|nr:hypothetical protein QYE76_038963 [Lolium multiflorum]